MFNEKKLREMIAALPQKRLAERTAGLLEPYFEIARSRRFRLLAAGTEREREELRGEIALAVDRAVGFVHIVSVKDAVPKPAWMGTEVYDLCLRGRTGEYLIQSTGRFAADVLEEAASKSVEAGIAKDLRLCLFTDVEGAQWDAYVNVLERQVLQRVTAAQRVVLAALVTAAARPDGEEFERWARLAARLHSVFLLGTCRDEKDSWIVITG